jgi:hypothetical protein
MHLDCLVHSPGGLLAGAPRSHAAGKVRRIGRVVPARPFNHNQEAIHRALLSLRPRKSGLLENAVQGARSEIITRVSSDCNPPWLVLMLVLPMAPPCYDQEPAIRFYQPDDISNLHPRGPGATAGILAWEPSVATQREADMGDSAARLTASS